MIDPPEKMSDKTLVDFMMMWVRKANSYSKCEATREAREHCWQEYWRYRREFEKRHPDSKWFKK